MINNCISKNRSEKSSVKNIVVQTTLNVNINTIILQSFGIPANFHCYTK